MGVLARSSLGFGRGATCDVRAGEQQCAFCSGKIVDMAIACHSCGSCFHGVPGCVGVSVQTINCIMNDKDAIKYFCCDCRLHQDSGRATLGDSSMTAAVSQMYKMVALLAKNVENLMNRMDSLPVAQGVHNNDDRKEVPQDVVRDLVRKEIPRVTQEIKKEDIRSELRELDDQNRRKQSIILRGFRVQTVEMVKTKFSSVCKSLGLGTIVLSDVSAIPGVGGLFRAKVTNDSDRYKLLASAKNLRDHSEFNSIYIQKDLTFNQRRELIERRKASQGQSDSVSGEPAQQGYNQGNRRYAADRHARTFHGRGRGRGGVRGTGGAHRGQAAQSAKSDVRARGRGGVHATHPGRASASTRSDFWNHQAELNAITDVEPVSHNDARGHSPN